MRRLLLAAAALLAVATPAAAHAEERHYSMYTGGGPKLGVQVTPLTDELRAFFGTQKDAGILIGKIEAGGAGEKAGLRVGDVLVSVGGTTVDDASDVRKALSGHKEGDTLPMNVVRDRKPLTLAVRVPKAEPPPDGTFSYSDFPREMRVFTMPDDMAQRLDAIEERLHKLEEKR